MRTHLLVVSILLVLLVPIAASAQWALYGNAVCTASGAQDNVAITANGLKGAVMVWQDNRGTSTDIYARQVGLFGNNEWTADGVALCTATGLQQRPSVVHDGFGYLLYTWEDNRNGDFDIYGAITDRLGNVFTTTNGFPISTGTGVQQFPVLTSNQALGVGYVTWQDSRNGNNDIYAQAFNVYNNSFWTANGLAFCTDTNIQSSPVIAPGGTDGAIVAWQDFRNGNFDIYAQCANLSGSLLWTTNGVAVCTQTASQTAPMIVSDGAGGAIIAWQDSRAGAGKGSIYAQRVNSSGVPQWLPSTGVPIVVSTDLIILPKMIADGSGGAYFAWEDDRNISTTGPDLYAQRINASGVVQWTANGVVVSSAPYAQYNVTIAIDGLGGVVAAWYDYRSLSTADLYTQRLNGSGVPQWTANGAPLCLATGNQFGPAIAESEPGASIVAWEDRRTATVADVYAQRIDDASGLYGYPAPYITSIVDVPNDEGGFVRLTFRPADGDPPGTECEIYDNEYHGGDVVGLITLNGSSSYTTDVLTVGVGVPNTYSIYCGAYSNSVQGTSIDNLAPPAPTLSGQRNGSDVSLTWNSTAGDIDHYSVERGDVGVLTTTTSPSYTDTSVPLTELRYRVRAVDIHGNVGSASNEIAIATPTGIGTTPSLPKALTLLPNSPNPFEGTTSLHVGLPKAGEVRVEVYDVAGRRVASRTMTLAAGWRDVIFDGRGDSGQPLASGVYFYSVHAAGETHTRKMVISR